jgi:fatty-acyl-CoA synthase
MDVDEPLSNQLPACVANVAPTIAHALRALAHERGRGFTFAASDGVERHMTFAALSAEASRRGGQLLAHGFEPGDHVALIVPEPDEFVISLLGAFAAGLVPVPICPPVVPGRLDGSYLEGAARTLSTADVRGIVTTASLAGGLGGLGGAVSRLQEVVAVEALSGGPRRPLPDPDRLASTDVALLQFTSGSTTAPRGARVTHGNLLANCRAIADSIRMDVCDTGICWLPLFHDMGLVGFVFTAILFPTPVVFLPTISFLKRPSIWMQTVHRHRGTITFAPNFAFALLTRLRPADHLDLSCLRVLGCGAEPIHADTMRTFLAHYEPSGLRRTAIVSCYGMAEATLAMSFIGLNDQLRTDVVDADGYSATGRAVPLSNGAGARREFVSCGRPIAGHEIRIVDEAERPLPERHVGEIVFQGPSVTAGYHRDAEATRQTYTGVGLRTGDLGYLADGELFVTGRKKDLLILNGRNYDPQLVERAVEEVRGVRRGNVAAFTIDGLDGEELVVAAEVTRQDHDALATEIRRHVYERIQLSVADVALVAGGSLPKTSSGKLQRSMARVQYLEGLLAVGGAPPAGLDQSATRSSNDDQRPRGRAWRRR